MVFRFVAGCTSTRCSAFLCHFGGTSHDDAKPKSQFSYRRPRATSSDNWQHRSFGLTCAPIGLFPKSI
ncbi:hypothetical protein OPV22_015417 [Ensete ventricosum]|uniref:Secreted protein n=1 Tax=Ensete ventricosum TaxID=4639 RepID=A0AAV8RE61_ENSVE|nr:hypothetical protein OPV22_015417 [Ensete ventricosum]